MKRRKETSGGQALIMVTLALFAMTGMLGLAVDLGWSFFVQKEAQAAADGAALSSVEEAVLRVRAAGATLSSISCSTADCEAIVVPCPVGSGSNLNNGCQYALKNGFNWTAPQNVTIQSGVAPPPPTAPSGVSLGVNNISYWVTVRTVQTIPQLFSVVLGNTQGTVAAIATAAFAERAVQGDLILTDDPSDTPPGAGGGSVTAPLGITMASSADAGMGTTATTPFTEVAAPGNPGSGFPNVTDITPASNVFDDPEQGKGQPPLCPRVGSCSTDYNNLIPVPGADMHKVCSTACPPGVYYATTAGGTVPTGLTLTIPDGTIFENTTGATSGFGNYVFVGGAVITGTVTMSPGRYVMVGTNSAATDTLNVIGTVIGGTGTSDAGRILILTNSAYQAYAGDTNMSTILAPLTGLPALSFGPTEFAMGNGTSSFSGLNPTSSAVPSELQNFAPVVIWQDQQNSTVKYNSAGYPVDSGFPSYTPNPGGSSVANATITFSGGSGGTHGLDGVVYQPRGAYSSINGTVAGNFVLVTGAMTAGGALTLSSPAFPLLKAVTTLIQ